MLYHTQFTYFTEIAHPSSICLPRSTCMLVQYSRTISYAVFAALLCPLLFNRTFSCFSLHFMCSLCPLLFMQASVSSSRSRWDQMVYYSWLCRLSCHWQHEVAAFRLSRLCACTCSIHMNSCRDAMLYYWPFAELGVRPQLVYILYLV